MLVQAVRALTPGETVHINVLNGDHEAHVRALVGAAPGPFEVRYHHILTNDAWCRDHGAIFVVRAGEDAPVAATDWGYNAWGGKYPPTTSTSRWLPTWLRRSACPASRTP